MWARPRADEEGAEGALSEAIAATGAQRCAEAREAVNGAEVVIAAVPAGASEDVAGECLPHLGEGAVYADLSSAHPEVMERVAAMAADAGVAYADVAVLGTVAASGARLPMLASGPAADRVRELLEPAGLRITTIDAPAGAASRVKMLRSVYMKGRDALVVEMLAAARRHGVEDVVAHSIAGPGEQVPFPALADRLLTGLAVHARRRAEELEASAQVLREAGVEPLAAAGGAERLRRLAALGLRERFGGERPHTGAEVLDALDQAAGDGPPGGPAERRG